jgi:ABC-type branched-subunit amino acid transport system substrate-binding protein
MRMRLRAIGAALGSWALGLPTVRAQTPAPLLLHHIGPFTGVLAASNQEAIDGARLFLDGFNARGGLQGRAVRLQTLDDAQDPKRAVEHFEALVASRQVLALLLPRTTPAMEALLPGVARSGVPVIGPQTGASFVNQPPRRELFTLRASYQKEAEVAVRQQHSIGMRRFGLLLADDAFGRDTLLGIERTFKDLGLEAAATARIDNRKPDVTGPLQQMLAQRPQVVLLIVSSKASSDFVKGYRAAGGQATFISLSNTSNNDYVKALGDQAAGAIVMQVMPSPFAATTPLAREYGAAAARGTHAVSYAGLYGFASAKLATLALARAGAEPTRDSLIRALEGLGEVDLGGYRLRYGPGDRTGSTYVDSTIITAQGRFRR